MPQDVSVAIVAAHLEVNRIRAVPLIQHLFDNVVLAAELKANRALLSLVTRIALYAQCHCQ